MKIGFVGYENWCNVTAGYLSGSRYEPVLLIDTLSAARGWSARRQLLGEPPVRDVRIVHSVNAMWSLRWLSWFRWHGRRIVLHWIGSDYRKLAAESALSRRRLLAWIALLKPTHLIDSPELADDLAELGVRGRILRLLPETVAAGSLPLPPKPAVMAYWSDGREDFYGRRIVYQLAEKHPDVPFRIVGTATQDPDAPANVEFLGRLDDLEPVYRSVSVLIRVLPHDSLSAMVLEALARARHAIYSKPFPHTYHATDEPAAAEALADHLRNYRPNEPGAAHVAENFNPKTWARRLIDVYDAITT